MSSHEDVITYAMSGVGPYQSTTLNNGGGIVESPKGSGWLSSSYTFGLGYNGSATSGSTQPFTGTVFDKYSGSFPA